MASLSILLDSLYGIIHSYLVCARPFSLVYSWAIVGKKTPLKLKTVDHTSAKSWYIYYATVP